MVTPRRPDSRKDPRTDLDARLEAEIESALGDMSLEDMLEMSNPAKPASGAERATKTGTVVSIHGDDVFVEFGPKSQGVCPLTQFDEPPKTGERLEFNVERFDEGEGLLVLSRQGAVQKAQWDAIEVGQVVEGRVTAVNKGGLEVEIAQHRAFMPAGQVDIRHIADLSVFVGEKIPCEIIELDKRNNRIILSRKNVLETERAAMREKLLETLAPGQEVRGVVTSLQQYGAFVDIGGVDGLVHISDLSYSRINHPREAVKEGEEVTVRVLKVDKNQDPVRISLGLKQTMTDPFQAKAGELTEGATVTGRVTKIMPFGAFVEIAPGIEGLIHISEIAHEHVTNVNKYIKADEIVTVKILQVDSDRQRISLSLKALKAEKEAEAGRVDDGAMRKLRAKFGGGDNLKGGLG